MPTLNVAGGGMAVRGVPAAAEAVGGRPCCGSSRQRVRSSAMAPQPQPRERFARASASAPAAAAYSAAATSAPRPSCSAATGAPRVAARRGVSHSAERTYAAPDASSATASAASAQGPPKVSIRVASPDASAGEMSVTVESDSNLRLALLTDKRVELYHGLWAKAMNCGGGGNCGTCVVQVLDDASGLLSERTQAETKKLKGKPETWRLACQTFVGDGQQSGDCTVRVGPK